MRTVAAIPAVALLVGSALGLLEPDLPRHIGYSLLVAGTVVALCAWFAVWGRVLAGAVGAAFLGGAALAGAAAWREAWRPTLLDAFETLVQAQRAEEAADKSSVADEDNEAFAIVSGRLRGDAAAVSSGISLSLDVDQINGQPVAGGVAATVVGSLASDLSGAWRAGRRLRLPIRLRRPSRYLDPGVPDHERELARRGTRLVGTVKSGALVEVVARGSGVAEAAAAARAFVRRAIRAAVGRWSARSAGIVAAIVIGDRAGLEEDVQRALQEAGIYHVIAISGGNIAILAGLMLTAFRLAGWLGPVAAWSAVGVLVGYGYLVGGGASVDRATLMAAVCLAGQAIDQRSPPTNTLAVVAGCLVAAQPLTVIDPAFVLTFGATFAILLVVPVLADLRLPGLLASTAAIFVASLAAEAALFPIGATLFSRVTFAGLVLNFLAIPAMAVAQIAGMATVPVALISPAAAAAAGYVAHLGASGLVESAGVVRLVSGLTYRVAPPHWGAVATYYVALGVAWTFWRKARIAGTAETRGVRRMTRGSAAVAACAAIWILTEPWRYFAARGDGRLHMTFVDVGQGDAAFVRFPRGATMLVDAGGLYGSSFDIGDRVVAPVMRAAGVRGLDFFVLTHGDPDHIGGAGSIIREFRPREVWEGIAVPRVEPLRALRDAVAPGGVRWVHLTQGDRLVIEGVEVAVLHPPPADWERQRVRNDDSIVIELRWRDASVLLTGDIGTVVEEALAPALRLVPLRVVKVAHHGSVRSSSEGFVRAASPQIAVVSVGRGNRFGHPAPEVLARYRAAGAEVFRTDRDGAVTVDTDGTSLEVHTFTGRTLALK